MERKDFLRNSLGFMGMSAVLIDACKKEAAGTNTTTTTGGNNGSCTVSATETDGPYPLYTSRGSTIQRIDVTDGKTGMPMNMLLTVRNVNDNCNVVANARVDIWHCDKDGYYSGYINNGFLGTQDNTSETFCRGLQYTDSNGQVNFITVYPGWYTGRITHIHAQVYVDGNLKLTTQIAFPQDITTAVYNTSLYSAHGQNTSVASIAADNVFSDGTDTEMATLTANSSTGGYDLEHTIYISA